MKHNRIFSLLLVTLIMFSLAACGGNQSTTDDSANQLSSTTMIPGETNTAPDLPNEEQIFFDYMSQASQEYDFTHIDVVDSTGAETGTVNINVIAYGQEVVYGDTVPAIGIMDARTMTYQYTNDKWVYSAIDGGFFPEKYLLPEIVALFSQEWADGADIRAGQRAGRYEYDLSIQLSADGKELNVLSGYYLQELDGIECDYFPCSMTLVETSDKPFGGVV